MTDIIDNVFNSWGDMMAREEEEERLEAERLMEEIQKLKEEKEKFEIEKERSKRLEAQRLKNAKLKEDVENLKRLIGIIKEPVVETPFEVPVAKVDVKKTEKIEKPKSRPCPYCSKPCFGRQCKECHLSKLRDCKCGVKFSAILEDGKQREMCKDCQKKKWEQNMKDCPMCTKRYKAVLLDGRTFDICLDCHKKKCEENIGQCPHCPNKFRIVEADGRTYDMCKYCEDKQFPILQFLVTKKTKKNKNKKA